MRRIKWCPNGCGKSVHSIISGCKVIKKYECMRCKKKFSKEELQNFKDGKHR